ncbi:protein Yng1p [[Candida] jaroonii]|uniref:Protein Yng1p n=1 Tax=[Candida] jaroonii TaxID=467808 RepID=A0ACA9Y6J1_9ASCO|nr:protein Yng1p [[Candida] jaroonii]
MSTVNSFISHTDHLPSDIIRSLWLLQSINVSLDKNHEILGSLQKQLQESKITLDDFKSEYSKISEKLNSLADESIEESKALNNQLIIYNVSLDGEIGRLNHWNSKKTRDSVEFKNLRDKLKVHYKENPLTSQREALIEKQRYDENEKLIIRIPSTKSIKKSPKSKKFTSKHKLKKITTPTKQRSHRIKPNVEEIQKSDMLTPPPEPVFIAPQADEEKYCFCKQGSFGDMIGCDNEKSCPNGDWFHYKCVGLTKVEGLKYASGGSKWFCSDHCREVVENRNKKKRKKRW